MSLLNVNCYFGSFFQIFETDSGELQKKEFLLDTMEPDVQKPITLTPEVRVRFLTSFLCVLVLYKENLLGKVDCLIHLA